MDDKHKAEIYSGDWIITMIKIDHKIKVPTEKEIIQQRNNNMDTDTN